MQLINTTNSEIELGQERIDLIKESGELMSIFGSILRKSE